jgi:hypothetical protein
MKIFLDNIDRKTVQNVCEPKNYHITLYYALSSLHFLLATCNPAILFFLNFFINLTIPRLMERTTELFVPY